MSNRPILTKRELIRQILEKDAEMRSKGFKSYVQRSHLHTQARLFLVEKHPILADFINDSYAKSGVIDSDRMLQELRA